MKDYNQEQQKTDLEIHMIQVNTKKVGPDNDNQNSQQENKKAEEIEKEIGFFQLFRYATGKDKFYMVFGAFMAFANGTAFPLFSLVFGEMIDAFGPNDSKQKIVDQAWKASQWFFVLAGASLVASWIQMFTWIEAGERQAITFRKKYLEALMKQDISWFDKENPNSLASKIAQDTFAIQGAIGEKVSTFINTVSMVVGGFVVAFISGWELALICSACLPFIGLAGYMFTNLIQTSETQIQESYTEASAQTEQTVAGIKTVKSLNGEEHEEKIYVSTLKKAYDTAIKYGYKTGTSVGFLWFVIFTLYAVGFWAGSQFIGNDTENDFYGRPYTAGDVIAVFFSIMIGGFSLGQAGPCLKSFGLGKKAGYRVLQVIDHKPTISPAYETGKVFQNVQGNIQLQKVEFTYPTKQDVQVLKSISLKIKAGQKTALVGESGCGKSTIMQLVERFYDVDKGKVLIDGENIKGLNLKWLRSNIGYVGQEPVLFATTIEQNLKFGKPDATEQEIISALKQANAYDFVMGLQDKLQTFVGTSGSQLSGGQKQRLCIARAILKNPQILLLDEATSALDRKNEKSIQETLDQISKNRTTIVIAHRLSTVQNSDHIIVIDQGRVVEEGNHNELVNKQGKYFALCQNQIQQDQEEGIQQQQLSEEVELQENQNNIKNKAPHNFEIKQQKSKYEIENNINNKQDIDEGEQKLSKEEEKKKKKEEEKKDEMLLSRLKDINKPESLYMWIGAIFSFIGGLPFPMTALVMAKMIDTLARVEELKEDDEFEKQANLLGMYFLIIAVVSGVAAIFQFASWQRVAEGLTLRLRQQAFAKICRMPIAWFDEKENNPGTLASKIGTDTQKVNQLTSSVVNVNIANFSSLVSGLTLAFIYDWRTTAVSLGLIPFIIISGEIQAQFTQGFGELTDTVYKESGNIVSESVTNMRTVLSFTAEQAINKNYADKLNTPESNIAKNAHKTGLAFGFSQMVMFIIYGLQFYIGAIFSRDYGTDPLDMYVAIFGIMYAAFGAGNNNQFMGDVGKAKSAARSLFELIDSEDEIQAHEKNHKNTIKSGKIQGNIQLKNVSFKYPSRDQIVLNNINLQIQSGEKFAFVGPSGCGKSTIMQLLLRFYEPLSGEIYIDGKEIHEYDIKFLRSQLGVVNQEPILFQGTIRENIKYNVSNATLKMVQSVAKQANAHDFIQANEFEILEDHNQQKENQQDQQQGQGYDRQVGSKGGQLSGGQKQRIAIARALIKQPNILLLDEATSALDAKNEKIVQDSLDKIMGDKTTLAIAHRISTIKDSKTIFVMEEGNIVEKGNYQELQNNKSYFYRLERGETK